MGFLAKLNNWQVYSGEGGHVKECGASDFSIFLPQRHEDLNIRIYNPTEYSQ